MNPCPCGHLGDKRHVCRCTPTQIQKYRARISGPLLDRIDLHVEAPALGIEELQSAKPVEYRRPASARARATRACHTRPSVNIASSTPCRPTSSGAPWKNSASPRAP